MILRAGGTFAGSVFPEALYAFLTDMSFSNLLHLDIQLTPSADLMIQLFSSIPQLRVLEVQFASIEISSRVSQGPSHPTSPLLPQLVQLNLPWTHAFFSINFPSDLVCCLEART